MKVDLKMALKFLLGAVGAFWVSLPSVLPTLLIFMALDVFTGFLAAFINRTVHSGDYLKGLAKKTLTLLLIITVHIGARSLGIAYDIGSLVAIAYIANELISITENCTRAGVPVPKVLVDALKKIKTSEYQGLDRRDDMGIPNDGPERRAESDKV